MISLLPNLNVIFLVLAILAFGQPLAFGAAKTEWLLVQHHQEAGNDRIYITDDAVRLENIDRGFQILAKAPDWRVEIFRPDEKLVYKMDLNHFQRFSIWGQLDSRATLNDLAAIKKQTVNDGRLKKTRYFFGRGEIWLADNVSQSKQIEQFLTYYYRAPRTGIPLYIKMVFSKRSSGVTTRTDVKRAEPETYLSTKSASVIPYKASDFAYPVGYTEVKAYAELLSKKTKKGDMEMIMNGFGFSEPLLKGNKGKGK